MASINIRVGRRVRFEWHKTVIDSFTKSPEGMVSRWVHRLILETLVVASARTKFGTAGRMHLSAEPRLWQSYAEAPYRFTNTRVVWQLGNTRPYAKHVFVGTGRPIVARKKPYLTVGKSQLGLPAGRTTPKELRASWGRRGRDGLVVFRSSVRDNQRPVNYPMEALRFVLAKGLIR